MFYNFHNIFYILIEILGFSGVVIKSEKTIPPFN